MANMTPETDAARLADLLQKHHEEMTKAPWYPCDGAAEGFSGSWDIAGDDNCGIASMADTASVAKYPRRPQANAKGVAAIRNALPDIIAALRSVEGMRKADVPDALPPGEGGVKGTAVWGDSDDHLLVTLDVSSGGQEIIRDGSRVRVIAQEDGNGLQQRQ